MLGHSQGSAHTARLIDELVDTNAKLRKRFVGAIAPGRQHQRPDRQVGRRPVRRTCPPARGRRVRLRDRLLDLQRRAAARTPSSRDSTSATGSTRRIARTRASTRSCAPNPALLDGGDGTLEPLVNFDYLFGVPAGPETAAPWRGQPDYYEVECKRKDGAHWLNLSKTDIPGDTRTDLGAAVASGSNYHVPEVNLAEGNLLTIAQNQTDAYEAHVEKLQALEAKLAKAKDRLAKHRAKVAKLRTKLRKADDVEERRELLRKWVAAKNKVEADHKEIRSLKRRIEKLDR